MPPVPPQVAAQQGPPPIRQFAQGATGAAPAGANGQGQDPSAMMSGLVNEIGQKMTQLAQVMGTTKPELIPILKQAVQALVMVAGKLKTQGPGGPPGQPPGGPPGGDQGAGGEGAPDAGGGAAMGMPQ